MKLVLIRHTKPDVKEGLCYGQTDLDVLPSFYSEVSIILDRLKQYRYNTVYSSPLKRCRKLAEQIITDNTILEIDDRIKELNFGDWEMLSWQEIYKKKDSLNWFNDFVNARCPEGESYKMLLERVGCFLEYLRGKDKNETYVIIAHAGIITAMHVLINKVNPEQAFKFSPAYGEIVEFELN